MKQSPHSIEAEQQLLGAILINNEAFIAAGDIVKPEHFFEKIHGEIFQIISTLIRAGKLASPLTIGAFLPEDTLIDGRYSVPRYLAHLAAEATTVVNAKDFAQVVRDLADRRLIAEIGQNLVEANGDAGELATYGVDMLDSIVAGRMAETARAITLHASVVRAVDRAAIAYQNDGMMMGLPWNLRELDYKTLGMEAATLIVVAGRPGMGKSAFLGSVARGLGRMKRPGVIFSLEMGDIDMSMRMLSDEMHERGIMLPYAKMKSGKFRADDFEAMRDAAERLLTYPLTIEQQPALGLAQIGSRLRQAKRRDKIEWAAIDHIGLMASDGAYRGNRAAEMGEITKGLKGLAKELGIPIIALAQINRGVESREDKRPQLSDLRDSGRIEEDADAVLMLYRKAYYLERSVPGVGTAEYLDWEKQMNEWHDKLDIGVEKNRNGPIGVVRVRCEVAYNAIRDMPRDEHLPTEAFPEE